MNLLAIIPSGQTEITVNGLHQWDYGRLLEIRSNDLPALIEVHFACSGMDEAVVRTCASVDGVVTAAIPDSCLEQTTPIVAWVYELNNSGSSGQTIMTIKLPIMARPKPAPRGSVPTTVSDQYTELISSVNAVKDELIDSVNTAIDGIAEGNVTVQRAIKDGDGNVIKDTYLTKSGVESPNSKVDQADNAINAGYALGAGYATSSGDAELLKYSLFDTIEIVEGHGTLSKDFNHFEQRENGLLCLAVFEVTDSDSNKMEHITWVKFPKGSYYGLVYQLSRAWDITILYSTSSVYVSTYGGDYSTPSLNGTLKLYKIAVEKED